MGRMDKEKGGFNLYMPKIVPSSDVPKRRATLAGMWYRKGSLLERTFEDDEATGERRIKLTKDPFSKWLMAEIAAAKEEMARIQDIYVELGEDPYLHNGNYELQLGYAVKETGVAYEATLWGYRPYARKYVGQSFKDVCRQYRDNLETYLQLHLAGFIVPELTTVKPKNKHWMIEFVPKNSDVSRAYNRVIEELADELKYSVFHQVGSDDLGLNQAWEFWYPDDSQKLKELIPKIHERAMSNFKSM